MVIVPTCKRLVAGAVPSLNLPEKSIPSTSTAAESQSRREIVRHELKPKPCYSSLEDLKKQVQKLKLTGWNRTVDKDNLIFELWDESFALPRVSVTIDESLSFSVAAFNWLLPADHILYKTYKRSVCHTTVSNVLHSIQQLQLCAGIPVDDHSSVAVIPVSNESGNIVCHTVPHNLKCYEDSGPSFQATFVLRSQNCEMLGELSKCSFCEGAEISMIKKTQTVKGKEPARPVNKSKAPLTQTSKERLVATVHQQRVVVKDLEGRISELEADIEKNSITINESLEKDL